AVRPGSVGGSSVSSNGVVVHYAGLFDGFDKYPGQDATQENAGTAVDDQAQSEDFLAEPAGADGGKPEHHERAQEPADRIPSDTEALIPADQKRKFGAEALEEPC